MLSVLLQFPIIFFMKTNNKVTFAYSNFVCLRGVVYNFLDNLKNNYGNTYSLISVFFVLKAIFGTKRIKTK